MKRLVLILLLLAGCDKVVSTTPHPEQAFTQKGTTGCNKGPGYCYACGLGFNGKYECNFAMKVACPGTRPVTYHVTPTTLVYESGKSRVVNRRTIQSIDGMCR